MKPKDDGNNFYLNLRVKCGITNKQMDIEVELNNDDECVVQEYDPTDKEKNNIMSIINNCFRQNYGCSLSEFCDEFNSQEWKMEGMN